MIISTMLNLLIELIKSMSVVIVLAYMLTRSKFYTKIMENGKMGLRQKLCLIAIFSLFAIYGSLSGIKVGGAIANIRDLGPAIAGLIGGPAVGLSAGLIGGAHRYFMGGITRVPCSISTIMAGLIGGLINQYKKDKFISIAEGAVFMALMESFHMVLVLLLVRPLSQAVTIVKNLAIPMIFINSLGIILFVFIMHNLKKEREIQHIKESVSAELNVATHIQSSMLPCTFPAFPDRSEFDIYATMKPARKVGGDFYDFFLIDGDHFAVVIADVSGKGIPAALFMMTAKTLIKNQAQLNISPANVFTSANEQLCENNEAGMFVTAFMGVLEISTGRFTYVNAGHNPPLIKKSGGQFYWLKTRLGFVLGGMEGIHYRQEELIFEKNDIFFSYTDGVTEALNYEENLYGNLRLLSTLNQSNADIIGLHNLLDFIQADIEYFSDGAEQADDITMLVLKYMGVN